MFKKIIFLICLGILIFIVFFPIIFRSFNPQTKYIQFGMGNLTRYCVGVVVPTDWKKFSIKEDISFQDAATRDKNMCFGFDIYYGE